ncbi:MAG: hypothetical protein DRI44_09295 [Chlamydiae bacterium]|nr:MAG: hypothetical protein DRI44_09295 [Chlamydiota bacterium]
MPNGQNEVIKLLPGNYHEANTLIFDNENITISGYGDQSVINNQYCYGGKIKLPGADSNIMKGGTMTGNINGLKITRYSSSPLANLYLNAKTTRIIGNVNIRKTAM